MQCWLATGAHFINSHAMLTGYGRTVHTQSCITFERRQKSWHSYTGVRLIFLKKGYVSICTRCNLRKTNEETFPSGRNVSQSQVGSSFWRKELTLQAASNTYFTGQHFLQISTKKDYLYGRMAFHLGPTKTLKLPAFRIQKGKQADAKKASLRVELL
jgi:hypothetical protein